MNSGNRAWRCLVTIACFVAFGLGGTLLSAFFFPMLAALPGSSPRRHARARRVVGFFFRLLVRILEKSGCMRLETSGLERLKGVRGALILANHPSYIDVVVLLSLLPQANCVVKGALWRNPFYWGIVRAAGYINNTSPEAVVDACSTALAEGESLLLFPEGTRTVPGSALQFLRGAAHIALKAKPAIVPVLIFCNPPTLTKGEPFWRVPATPFTFRVDVLDALPSAHFGPATEDSAIGARRLTDALQRYFSQELTSYGYA